MLTKLGSKGIINLDKLVPGAGRVIDATMDAIGTNTIGKIAKDKLFINPPSPDVIITVKT